MSEWFRVEVTDRDGQIVAIESEMLTGRDIGEAEEATIRKAIAHLSGFVGRVQRERCTYPDCGCTRDVRACQ